VTKGAFPTFELGSQDEKEGNGESEDHSTPKSKSPKQKKGGKGKKSRPKRKRAETLDGCKACFGPHDLAECFYAIENKAPPGWKLNQGMQKMVQLRLESDIALAEEVKRLTKGKTEEES